MREKKVGINLLYFFSFHLKGIQKLYIVKEQMSMHEMKEEIIQSTYLGCNKWRLWGCIKSDFKRSKCLLRGDDGY